MALSQTQPYEERVREIACRMKEIIETKWSEDPELVSEENEEFRRLKQELEFMGLYVTWNADVVIDGKGDIKVKGDINVYASRNTTLQ